MSKGRLRKPFLPISWYLALFIAAALIPVSISAYLSLRQANAIEEQAKEQTQNRARVELLREMEHLGQELTEVGESLAGWDETRALFADPTYYNYWKETRVRDVAHYRGLIDAVDLFRRDGKPLTPDATMSGNVYTNTIERPSFLMERTTVYLMYYHPVYTPGNTHNLPLGYVGVRMNITAGLEGLTIQGHGAVRQILWHLPASTTMSVRDGVAAAELQVAPSPEIEALSHLVRRGYLEHVGYSFGLLALLGALLSYSVARPLTRLAGYLREIYSGGVNLIPQDFHGAVNIMELENVRQALNDYKDRFIAAAATLEEKNKELLHLTFHDPLTGRYNRRAFEARLAHASETAVIEHQRHALCYVDLDQFKLVNDTCGHVAGDELLKQIAALLQGEIRGSDMLARLGGDEFGILFESCELDKATRIAEAIRLKVKKHRFVWQNTPFDISISIGLAAITADNPDVADALKNADAACYVAKESGRNRLQIYEQHDKELAQRHGEMQWVSRLQQALEENRFELYGQRIRPTLPDKNDCHYEVLLRLRNPDGQMVPPMAFIPAAERYNLMSSIDLWVVEHALDILVNHKRGPSGQPIMLAINLSGQSLGNKEILNRVQQWIETSGVGAERLCFEITETAAITNLTAAVDFIRSLRRLGCKFSLDDFGSGLSSFGYLSNLEIDFLKIDGHFITNILTDPVNRSIVGAINEIGHVMGIHTIAEFVENEAVVLELARIGVDYLQGYGIHKPEPLIELLDRLSTLPAADAPQRARN